MMTDLYLIAHKVRGEAAFDVAAQIDCPHCTYGFITANTGVESTEELGCHECDSLGFWWIVPTSGHRAYPWWNIKLDELLLDPDFAMTGGKVQIPPMPSSLPDHYTTLATPITTLAEMLGFLNAPLTRKAPPIKRRF